MACDCDGGFINNGPDVVPIPPVTGTTWTVPGDFPTPAAAIANASVVNGDEIHILAGVYVIGPTSLLVNKEITLRGDGPGITTLTTAGAAGDPIYTVEISANNVVVRDMTVKMAKTTNTSVESAIAVSNTGIFPIYTPVGPTYFDNLEIITMEFGIALRGNTWQITNCVFNYLGPAGNTHRFIGIYGMVSNCIVASCDFNCSLDGPTRRTIFLEQTSSGFDESYAGTLRVTDCMQLSGNLRQFMVFNKLDNGPISVYVDNNNYSDLSGSIILFEGSGSVAPLDFLTRIVCRCNTTPLGGGKGLLGLDGVGAGRPVGSTTYISKNNVLGPMTLAAGWSLAVGSQPPNDPCLAYNNSVYASPVTQECEFCPDPPIPPTPPECDDPCPIVPNFPTWPRYRFRLNLQILGGNYPYDPNDVNSITQTVTSWLASVLPGFEFIAHKHDYEFCAYGVKAQYLRDEYTNTPARPDDVLFLVPCKT